MSALCKTVLGAKRRDEITNKVTKEKTENNTDGGNKPTGSLRRILSTAQTA